jgi:thiol-disulfide isomerase/thioredoxin
VVTHFRARPRVAPPSRPLRTLTHALRVLVVGVVVALLAACATTGADEQSRSAGQEGYVGVKGNVTQIPPAERKPLPPVSGTSLDGRAVSTADYRDKVVVLNVWGSWCPPCREEAPALQAASVQTADVAQFVGITTKDADPAQPRAFVRVNKITYPSIFDPTGSTLLTFAGTLPPSAIPSTLIVDQQGRLAVRVLGPISELTLVSMVDDVAAGK